MNNLFLFAVLLVLCDLCFAGTFTIVGPKKAFLGSNYRAVLTANKDGPAQVDVTVKTPNHEIYHDSFNLNEKSKQEINFNVPNVSVITIEAQSNSGEILRNEIEVVSKNYDVLIQTDKAIYKPGDKVQFRVVVLDAEMKPFNYQSIAIGFRDGMKIKVNAKKFNFTVNGFVEDFLQLGVELNQGKWAIIAQVDKGQMNIHNFQVVDYSLPEFEAFVEPEAKHVLVSQNQIKVKFFAKYLIGSGQHFVKGRGILVATTYNPKNPEVPLQSVTKYPDQRGEVSFDFQRDLNIPYNLDEVILKLEGTFVDSVTRTTSSAQDQVVIHRTRKEKVEIIAESEVITPGEPYKVKVIVKDFDGSMVKERRKVQFKTQQQSLKNCSLEDIKSNMKWEKLRDIEIFLQNGVAEYTANVGKDVVNIAIGVFYAGSYHVHKAFRLPTKSRENFGLEVTTKNPKVGESILVKVKMAKKPSTFFSVIFGKKRILRSDEHEGSKQVLNFEVTPEMVPSSNLVVYYYQENGEIVFNQIKLEFEETLGNFLKINLKSKQVEPGTEISISGETKPFSMVAILAVDRKVSFLKSGNDFDYARVANFTNAGEFLNENLPWDRTNVFQLLEKSNIFVLTDAKWTQSSCENKRTRRSVGSVDEGAMKTAPEISETWIFKSVQADASGRFELREKVPEAFTSYAISGFSINAESGLGLTEPISLEVSKNFFIELDVPQSAFIGELLQVRAFVYTSIRASNAKITLAVNDFELFEKRNSGRKCSFVKSFVNYRTENNLAPGFTEFSFFIRANKEGSITLNIEAQSGRNSDQATKRISVDKIEYKTTKSRGKFFDLRNKKFSGFYFDMQPEENAIVKTIAAEASAVGDLLGPALENIHELLNIPSVTTRQKLSEYFPTIWALKYLKAINLPENTKKKGVSSLDASYQLIAARKLSGANAGAYSDSEDGVASIESTAFVAKFLSVTKEWIEIDDTNIVDALNFLKRKQAPDGKFSSQQLSMGATENDEDEVALTAFVVISFLENAPYVARFQETIKKSLSFIDESFNRIDDSYTLAISAYALALSKHKSANQFLEKLLANKIQNGDQVRWELGEESKNIETASYALLAYVQLEKILEGKEILNWLISQRKQNGRFTTPKANVIGLQAISEAAKHIYSKDFNLNVYFIYDDDQTVGLLINNDNAKKVQSMKVPTNEGVSVQLNGTGVAYVQIWQKYLEKNVASKKFDVSITPRLTGDILKLEVCLQFLANGGNSKSTVAKVALPSEFKFNGLTGDQKFISRPGRTVVEVIFDTVGSGKKSCTVVEAVRKFDVSNSIPYPVEVYEIEDRSKFDVEYYINNDASQCAA